MGAGISSEDRIKRQNLQKELRKMRKSLQGTAASHYVASEYYSKWDSRFHYASFFTGSLGVTVSVASKLAWKMLVTNSPRLAPIIVATSSTSLLFTALVNVHVPQIQSTPANLCRSHYRAGIECQCLERRVKFFAETEVWDSKIAWETLAAKYENLLSEKKDVNSKIQSKSWAYCEALKRKQKEWRQGQKWQTNPLSSEDRDDRELATYCLQSSQTLNSEYANSSKPGNST